MCSVISEKARFVYISGLDIPKPVKESVFISLRTDRYFRYELILIKMDVFGDK